MSSANINSNTKIGKKWYSLWKNNQTSKVKIYELEASMEPLKDKELLRKVKELANFNREKKAIRCGYLTHTKNGEKRVSMMKFLNALIDAEGIELDAAPNIKRQRKHNIKYSPITVQSSGKLIISSDYTKQIGLQPGDEVEITLGRKHIHLKMLERSEFF